ncbi:hypothetical protein C8D88_118111 [Lentzea atacamensis]|uniref:Uncharacterized protein n=1 Tax=Lentzea atacamensis TaxID=531938 RepID=A0A316HJF0_9PSEU|nr:hypothetical protein [Lentzea atacamensis]PWK81343.1 hypothetical protein C8D88_118111 [Lentzea atacamensis]
MNGLRIELRRSTALWAGLLVLVSSTGMLLLTAAGTSWQGNSTSAVLELRPPLAYVWALVVGLAVLQGMRDGRSGVTELFSSTSRPGWVRLGTLASAVAGVVAVATGLLCVGLVAVVAISGGFVSIGFVPLMVTVVLALASSVMLGIAVGRLLPHPLTVPVALVSTFVLATAAGQELEVQSPDAEVSRLALLAPVLDPPGTDLVTTSTSVDIGQIVWFTGLGVTAFLLLVSRFPGARLAALLPAGLAAVLALTILPNKISDVLVTDSIAGELVCDGPVCLSRAHEDRLPAVAAVGKEVLAKLAVLPDAPTEVREDTSAMAHLAAPQRNGKIVYLRSQGAAGVLTMSPEQQRIELLAGAGVAGCSTPNTFDISESVVLHLTAGYFNNGLAALPSEPLMWSSDRLRGEIETAWRALRAQPAPEQLNRVTRARQMLLACNDSEGVLDVLTAA